MSEKEKATIKRNIQDLEKMKKEHEDKLESHNGSTQPIIGTTKESLQKKIDNLNQRIDSQKKQLVDLEPAPGAPKGGKSRKHRKGKKHMLKKTKKHVRKIHRK